MLFILKLKGKSYFLLERNICIILNFDYKSKSQYFFMDSVFNLRATKIVDAC